MKDIISIKNNPAMKQLVSLLDDIPFAEHNGKPLSLKLLIPMEREVNPDARYPLVVFIQGSAWTTPNQLWQIPQLSELARRGYVVASVTHRSCFESPAPAFLQDVKLAIRFLRAHAKEYAIDPTRVCAWGTSSGGNTALLLGLTHGVAEFDTEEYIGFSSEVQAVVDCFGPTDLVSMAMEQYADVIKNDPDPLLYHLAGGVCSEKLDVLRSISPIAYVQKDEKYPPFLLLHGDADDVVLYQDTEKFYRKLCEYDYDATMYRIVDAPHEGSFWSQELLEIIFAFIDEKLR